MKDVKDMDDRWFGTCCIPTMEKDAQLTSFPLLTTSFQF
jgi:hypothetical protein